MIQCEPDISEPAEVFCSFVIPGHERHLSVDHDKIPVVLEVRQGYHVAQATQQSYNQK